MKLQGEYSQQYQNQKTSRSGISALKYGVPSILILLVLLLMYWPSIESYFQDAPQETAEVVQTETPQVEGTVNQAKNLHFDGVDSHKQPYTLVAKEGFEFEDTHSELKEPHLTINLNSGEVVTLSADEAKFERSKQKIELIGHVIFTHSTGYTFETNRAWIDLNDSSSFGHDPVNGFGPNGEISSQGGFQLIEKGDKIKFMGRSELYISKVKK